MSDEPAPLPAILLGATYVHTPSGQRVDVIDFEYAPSPKARRATGSARTGRYVVRVSASPASPPFHAAAKDLHPLPDSSNLPTRERTSHVFDDRTRVNSRPQPVAPAPPVLAHLQITRGPDASQVGRILPLRGEQVTIGRDSDNDVPLNDPDVSRHHARIVFREAQATLIDTQSTNGTVVNGTKITEAPLRVGDMILVGSTILTFKGP